MGNSHLPDQEDERIEYAFRIIMDAYKSKTQSMDNENRGLRLSNDELRSALSGVQKKHVAAERELVEVHQRNHQLQEEVRLLQSANKTLLRQVEKHKKLQQTFAEALDTHMHVRDSTTAASDDMIGNIHLASVANMSPQSSSVHGGQQSGPISGAVKNSAAPGPSGFSMSFGGRLPTPSASAAAFTESSTSPASGGIDGRAFFRACRSRLTHENFNVFLSSIKRLNNHGQSREETIEDARKIFGNDSQDLYHDFVQLISRHV